jgi:hypothetical protein
MLKVAGAVVAVEARLVLLLLLDLLVPLVVQVHRSALISS